MTQFSELLSAAPGKLGVFLRLQMRPTEDGHSDRPFAAYPATGFSSGNPSPRRDS